MSIEGRDQAGGRLTLPIEVGIDEEIHALMKRLKVDAVRNSDGTELPAWVADGLAKVYSTYFPSRGDEEWAVSVPEHRVRQFLMSQPVTATSAGALSFNVMEGYLSAQFAPDLNADREFYWQVIDRTTGRTLSTDEWSVEAAEPLPLLDNVEKVGKLPDEAASAVVTIAAAEPFHEYIVDFLAKQVWDSTQIYNYLTNDWSKDPGRLKDRTYDVAYPETWDRAKLMLRRWLDQHPEVDVVRFTTFFYHFTLAFDDHAKEKYVDWFGYSAAVSIPALEDFYAEHGYRMLPEDFVDGGDYNSPFRSPSEKFRDWIDFTARRVSAKAGELVQIAHEQGREAIMFLGDNWIGTEPYGPYFPSIGLDGVVGSVGSGATCRMISDIPGVKYTEGRFLPYFFPDVFRPGGNPVREASSSWAQARRAIVRKPLDRIGYGGYLSLALQFPEFIDKIEQIVEEFRGIHDNSEGKLPANAAPVVAILNAWGSLRTWQTNMVAHALWYKQIHSYLGVIEALAGLPVDVRFMSFDEVVESDGNALEDIDVLINAGQLDTAFSGGAAWQNPKLQQLIRQFVWQGGGFIGIGAPTSHTGTSAPIFQLNDVLGVDQEIGWSLHTTRYWTEGPADHFLLEDLNAAASAGSPGPTSSATGQASSGATAGLSPEGLAPRVPVRVLGDRHGMPEGLDLGEQSGEVIATGSDFRVLAWDEGSVKLGTNPYGKGRSVYMAGLPYSAQNTRLLLRAIMWSAGLEGRWDELPVSSNPDVELGWYPDVNRMFVFNNSVEPQETVVRGVQLAEPLAVSLEGHGSTWIQL